MEAIVQMSEERIKQLTALQAELKQKLPRSRNDGWIENYKRYSGYSQYTFYGRVSDKMVEALGRMPTADEMIIFIDNGFSHFGAECIFKGRDFHGYVNTD